MSKPKRIAKAKPAARKDGQKGTAVKAHRGEHEPIVDRALFEAVQTKLAASATARQLRLKGSPAILAGRIFDDRGNRMTPTHTNKRGARYRYYVSHALLQKRNDEAGSVRTRSGDGCVRLAKHGGCL